METPPPTVEQLKPCPFCGAAMHLDYDVKNGMFGPEGGHAPGCFIGTIDFRDFADEHQAVNEWNRRPTPPPDVAKLREALLAARNVLTNSDAESGYCMCGDPVDSHSIGSGHSPVDGHIYMAGKVIEQIDAALASQDAPSVDAERFLTAYVSQDAKVIGIEHDTDADWHEVQRAHEVLRDRLNVRLAERDKCPHKPTTAARESEDAPPPSDWEEQVARACDAMNSLGIDASFNFRDAETVLLASIQHRGMMGDCPSGTGAGGPTDLSPVPGLSQRRSSPIADELWLHLGAAFGPILKEAFPTSTAFHRHAVCDALANAVKARADWFVQP